MSTPPYYPCTGSEPVFDDIELLDIESKLINTIVASECFASWWCSWNGGTWRHRPVNPPPAAEGA